MATPAERAWAVFPGGSLGEYDLPAGLTVVLARGEGATVWDTDGRAKLYLSLAHTDADLARFLQIARATLREDCR